MGRDEVTDKILEAKARLGLTWKVIAERLGPASIVFYTAALQGHHTLTRDEARSAAALLELNETEERLLAEAPQERGKSLKMPPTDPLTYRFYELVQGYGPTLKALINEEFGDGIMSAIDFNMSLERESDPKGDRVRITMSGKFLPYKRF